MNIHRLLLSVFMLMLGGVGCATDPPDPDAPPPGPKAKVALVVVRLVFVSGNSDQMARDTATLISAFKTAGFKTEFAGAVARDRTGDPPYLGISTDHNSEYCLAGVARVHNSPPDLDVHFEVRQRNNSGMDMHECAKALVAKVMTRIAPQ